MCTADIRRSGFRSRARQGAQTLVFFALAMGLIILFCGLAIDSGLLYLAKARLARAVDGAALAAVGNFHSPPATVASIIRNFAVINFTDLEPISATATVPTGVPGPNNTVTFNFNDGTIDSPGGNYRRYVEAVLSLGPGGDVTSVVCNARCPVHTYFIGFSSGLFNTGGAFRDLKVTSNAVATRNPRLIMIVVDRSGSMLFQVNPTQPGVTGAYGLPQAVMTFLNFFDTSADHIGIVSFSSNARLEIPLTTNFLVAAQDDLYGSFQTNTDDGPNSGQGVAGVDPEQVGSLEAAYSTGGVRRLKFGGATAADEGIRLGMEQLMADPGFRNPDVFKYLVLFTDGAWNSVRTLVAAPGYTNTVAITSAQSIVPPIVTYHSNNLSVPSLMPYQDLTNALNDTAFNPLNHTNDFWQSIAASDASGGIEPVSGSGSQILGGATNSYLTNGVISSDVVLGTQVATNLDVWLQPGAVDYVYHNGAVSNTYVSDYTNPTTNFVVSLGYGDSNVLVVPGYIADGLINDAFDLPYPDPNAYPRYRADNYLDEYMWPDTNTVSAAAATPPAVLDPSNNYGLQGAGTSLMRQLLFRNYANFLTGYYISRPDDPLGTAINPFTGALRPINGNGPYYPSAAFYWPFDLVGVNPSENYSLIDPGNTTNDDGGHRRHSEYSINMLSPAAAPEWAGELFYKGTGAALSGATSASTLMGTAGDWQLGAPGFFSSFPSSSMITDPVHNTNLAVAVWRPASFQGSLLLNGLADVTPTGSATGGYVTDGAGRYYKNAMAYSGRPTHYYDFSNSTWKPIPTNHTDGTLTLQLGNWKAQEYAWHARNSGITIFTVGYGEVVSPDEQVLLAQIANATNTTAGPSNISYNPNQPIGQQFYAQNPADVSADFYQVGTAINAALTQ